MPGAAESYLQVSSVLCLMNCTISPDTLTPDCTQSSANCCSPDPMSCFSFYTCDQSRNSHLTFCGPLQSFNSQTLRCEHSSDTDCYPKCAQRCRTDAAGEAQCDVNTESCCLPNTDNCKYFTTCSEGDLGVGQCPADAVFDEQQLACVQGDQCYQNFQQCDRPCPDNHYVCPYDCCGPEIGFCSEQYYRCINGIRIVTPCPHLTRFNMTLVQCDAATYNQCTPKPTNFTDCESVPQNPATIPDSGAVTENRRLLTQEQFLSIMYSAYKNLTDMLTTSS